MLPVDTSGVNATQTFYDSKAHTCMLGVGLERSEKLYRSCICLLLRTFLWRRGRKQGSFSSLAAPPAHVRPWHRLYKGNTQELKRAQSYSRIILLDPSSFWLWRYLRSWMRRSQSCWQVLLEADFWSIQGDFSGISALCGKDFREMNCPRSASICCDA